MRHCEQWKVKLKFSPLIPHTAGIFSSKFGSVWHKDPVPIPNSIIFPKWGQKIPADGELSIYKNKTIKKHLKPYSSCNMYTTQNQQVAQTDEYTIRDQWSLTAHSSSFSAHNGRLSDVEKAFTNTEIEGLDIYFNLVFNLPVYTCFFFLGGGVEGEGG